MTSSLGSMTRQELKEKLRLLVEDYLAEHPEELATYRDAVVASSTKVGATTPGLVNDAGGATAAVSPTGDLVDPTGLDDDLDDEDESALDLLLITAEVPAAFAEVGPGPVIVPPAPSQEPASPTVQVDESTAVAILENGPDDEQIALMRSAGLAMTIEYD